MAIPGNIRPGDLARREVNINGAKNAVDFSLTKIQQVANPVLEDSIAAVLPEALAPRQVIQNDVDISTTIVKNKIQEAANRSIESDYSYGRSDSRVSRFTNWISDWIAGR